MSSKDLIKHYGTHVVLGYLLGAIFDYNLSVKEGKVTDSKEWNLVVNAATTYKQTTGDFGNDYKEYEELRKDNSSFYEKIITKGGQSQFASMDKDGKQTSFNKWLESLSDSRNWVMIDFENPGIIGIWELARDEKRREVIKNGVKAEIAEQSQNFKTAKITVSRVYKIVKRNDDKNTLIMGVKDMSHGYPNSEEIKIMDYNRNLNFNSGSFKPNPSISSNIFLDLKDDHTLVFEGSVTNPGYSVGFIGYQDLHSSFQKKLSYDAKTKTWKFDGNPYTPGQEFMIQSKSGNDVGVEIYMKLELY